MPDDMVEGPESHRCLCVVLRTGGNVVDTLTTMSTTTFLLTNDMIEFTWRLTKLRHTLTVRLCPINVHHSIRYITYGKMSQKM